MLFSTSGCLCLFLWGGGGGGGGGRGGIRPLNVISGTDVSKTNFNFYALYNH